MLDCKELPTRRTAAILRDLRKYNIDIAALSETKMSDEDKLIEDCPGYTLYWEGVLLGYRRQHVVGIAITNTLTR